MYLLGTTDYQELHDVVVVFNSTITRQCINVATEDDNVLEYSEDFHILLFSTDTNVLIGTSTSSVTINDNDCELSKHSFRQPISIDFMFVAVQVGFSQTVYPVNESDGRILICIFLGGETEETEREVTVEIFRIGGTGIYI